MSDRVFQVGQDEHDAGDAACAACARPYPQGCKCGGLIHATINWERGQDLMLEMDQEALDTKCDRCGAATQLLQRPWKPTPEQVRMAEERLQQLTGKKWNLGSDEEEPQS